MIQSRFAAPMVIVAALVCAAGTAADDQSATAPGLRPEPARLELGEVTAGAEATGTFVLHNDSAVNIRILRAKPS